MAMQVNLAKFPNGSYSTILRMALQSTDRFRESLPKTATFPVILDSGASISITPDRKDFVEPINTPGPITQLQGIAEGLRIEGQGHVLWAMQNTLGNLRMIKVQHTWCLASKSCSCQPQACSKLILWRPSPLKLTN
jgi:hypothetical protein